MRFSFEDIIDPPAKPEYHSATPIIVDEEYESPETVTLRYEEGYEGGPPGRSDSHSGFFPMSAFGKPPPSHLQGKHTIHPSYQLYMCSYCSREYGKIVLNFNQELIQVDHFPMPLSPTVLRHNKLRNHQRAHHYSKMLLKQHR